MSFLHPEFLYYMLPPMLILFGFLLTQKEQRATFFSQEVLEKLRVSANTLTLKARNALFLLMGILIVFALAGPVIKDGKVEVKAKSSDIMIALDISDSMLGEDVYPNRLKLAKQKALKFLNIAKTDRIGVIGFAKNSYLVSPLSFDHSVVSFLLKDLNTDSITEKGTDFLSMLEVVDKSLKDKAKRSLLILSDGGDSKDFSKEIAYAKEKNIAVFVLGIGTKKGAPIKKANGEFVKYKGEVIVSKLNEDISALATKTGGVYIKGVNSDADVKAMYKEILAHSEKKELKAQEIERFVPLFYYPLGLALFILLIATSSMSKREVVHVPSAFILSLFLFASSNTLHAGVLDFMKLDEAKKAYENKEYEKSDKIYSEYAAKSQKGDVNYNLGNALYKEGRYKEAVKAYKKATFDAKESKAKNYSNLGNAYVKSAEKKSLQKAIKAYEDSLKLKEDKDTRENLEAVKKYLEEQKKKEQKKKNKNKNKKKDKNKDKDKKNKDKKKNQKKDSDKKNKDGKKNDKSKDGKSKDKKSDKKSDKEKQGQKKKSDEEKKKEEQVKKDAQKKKSQEQKKRDAAKELKDKKKNEQKGSSAKVAPKDMKDKMSNEEEKKWLKGLNSQHKTFLYRLNPNSKHKENLDEKPW